MLSMTRWFNSSLKLSVMSPDFEALLIVVTELREYLIATRYKETTPYHILEYVDDMLENEGLEGYFYEKKTPDFD